MDLRLILVIPHRRLVTLELLERQKKMTWIEKLTRRYFREIGPEEPWLVWRRVFRSTAQHATSFHRLNLLITSTFP